MEPLEQQLQELAETSEFSGVLRVERAGGDTIEFARGLADRPNGRPNTLGTRFGVASATKGLTALTIMSLVEERTLSLESSVRSILGDQLAMIDEQVTIDHLLMHRSGIGDYLDEEIPGDVDDYAMGERSAHTLAAPTDYLDLLNAHPQRTAPDVDFVYNNSGYVVLSLVIEKLTGSFHQAVHDRVLAPAGMASSGFFRSDDLPKDTAAGYLVDGRTNVFHLPVLGVGDGGIYVTLDDVSAFWTALFAGNIVSPPTVERMTSAISAAGERFWYGQGFWLADASGQHVFLMGMDPGVSFQSGVNRATGTSYTVISNTSSGAWPLRNILRTM